MSDSTPKYMIFDAQQITKKVFTDMSKSPDVVARRPIGFVVKIHDSQHYRVYMEHDGVYYAGTSRYSNTPDLFLNFEFTDVMTTTQAVFTRMDEAA